MFRQAHIPLRVSTSELMSWGLAPILGQQKMGKYGKINRLSKATLTCAQCLVSPLQARAWSGNGHGSKFQKPQQGTQLPKQTAETNSLVAVCLSPKLREWIGRICRIFQTNRTNKQTPWEFSSLNTSAVAASQVLIGSRGRFWTFWTFWTLHMWLLQELGFFPSQHCSERPQRRCDFSGKWAATLQKRAHCAARFMNYKFAPKWSDIKPSGTASQEGGYTLVVEDISICHWP